jgi:hypothetical protein
MREAIDCSSPPAAGLVALAVVKGAQQPPFFEGTGFFEFTELIEYHKATQAEGCDSQRPDQGPK